MTEDQLQSKIFQYVWNEYPNLRRKLWAVPNGGDRNKREAAKFKATGVISGVHDLHFIYKQKFYTFELKVANNKFSENQLLFQKAIEQEGAICFEIRSFEQFINVFKSIIQ